MLNYKNKNNTINEKVYLKKLPDFYSNNNQSFLKLNNNLSKSNLDYKIKKIQELFTLSQHFKNIGLINKSCIYLINAIRLKKNEIKLYLYLSSNLKIIGKYDSSLKILDLGLKLDPNNINLLNNKANILEEQKLITLAIKNFKKVIKINPSYYPSQFNLARIYFNLGEIKKSSILYKKCIKLKPNCLKLLYQYYRTTKNKIDINKINQISKEEPSESNEIYSHFFKAKIAMKKSNFTEEIINLKIAHNLYYKQNPGFKLFNSNWNQNIKKIKDLTSHLKPSSRSKRLYPIFIVGLPRSGSTLIEKIISSSKVIPLEETQILFNTLTDFKNRNIKMNSIDSLINRYNKFKNIDIYKNRFTDKSLENFEFVDLIKKTIPNAKIINCIRDPKSSIISILKNNLISIPWAHQIVDILEYFDRYYKIVSKPTFKDKNFIYNLKFENLLNNPSLETKKIFKFCEIEWSPACLDFYKNNYYISTTNNEQLRKPINKSNLLKYNKYDFLFKDLCKNYNWLN